jgi:NodT family efflux transporter outer membrane factor (OMF) lipoprotein
MHRQQIFRLCFGNLQMVAGRVHLLGWLMLLASCAAGPDYQRPDITTPTVFGQQASAATSAAESDWKYAAPQLPDPVWWTLFGDPVLDELVQQLNAQNQDIRIAEARYRQARALASGARAGLYPSLTANAALTRGAARAAETAGNTDSEAIANSRRVALDASWEVDIWGRVRRDVEAGVAAQQAARADVASARLSAQAELVLNYYQLRIADTQKQLLDRTVLAYEKLLQMAQNRYAVGVAGRADIVLSQTQLNSAKAEAIAAELARIKLQNAIAVLLGKPPEQFTLAAAISPAAPLADIRLPLIPLSVPSQLLERRPDIAAAEQRVREANARIGVAQTARFPTLSLAASGGYHSNSGGDWLTAPHRFWALGPALVAPLFDGGLRKAQQQQALALHEETVLQYQQTVLNSFQEVEDNLIALQLLQQAATAQDSAVQSARDSERIANNQYKVGKVALLDVITLQAIANRNEEAALQLLGQRYAVCIGLIKSLGGGWDASQLAKVDQVTQ